MRSACDAHAAEQVRPRRPDLLTDDVADGLLQDRVERGSARYRDGKGRRGPDDTAPGSVAEDEPGDPQPGQGSVGEGPLRVPALRDDV